MSEEKGGTLLNRTVLHVYAVYHVIVNKTDYLFKTGIMIRYGGFIFTHSLELGYM